MTTSPEIRFVETVNDCGQTVVKRIDVDAIKREQLRRYRIAKVMVFLAPVLIPILKSRITTWIAVAALLIAYGLQQLKAKIWQPKT